MWHYKTLRLQLRVQNRLSILPPRITLRTFRKIVLPPSSGASSPEQSTRLGLPDPEDGEAKMLQNIRIYTSTRPPRKHLRPPTDTYEMMLKRRLNQRTVLLVTLGNRGLWRLCYTPRQCHTGRGNRGAAYRNDSGVASPEMNCCIIICSLITTINF